jgi:hypothetical protein
LLAAEHWSLLATRSTAQSEVLSRITTFLMLVSSSIVSLALVGQVTHFGGPFVVFALVLVGMLVVIGTLTQLRLGHAAIEDLGLVIGMNRLRAGYAALDPGVERYFVTGAHDDSDSVWRTYNHLVGPRPIAQPLASSATFILVLNAALAGLFAALIAFALGAAGLVVVILGILFGLAFVVASILFGMRQYRRIQRSVLFPS